MDKLQASRCQKRCPGSRYLAAILCLITFSADLYAVTLSQAEALRIGKRIWQNECNGTVSGLTSWNAGENFASLGIGHFIWYPKGVNGPFEESFPRLLAFVAARGAKMPGILLGGGDLDCPWSSRSEFVRAQQTSEMKQLRQFLVDTIEFQAQFLVDRLQRALPKMLEETSAANRPKVQRRFEDLSKSAQGCYALIDYVNFKGEGVLHTERYHGQGWGLLQVLETIDETSGDSLQAFAQSAASVLKRRVRNAPPARNESRWLPGWLRRVNSYSRG